MHTKTAIGKTGLQAFHIGLGAGVVGNTMMYPKVTEDMGKEIIHAALDHGIDFIDTAYLYGLGRSEELIGEALQQRGIREQVVLSTKASSNPQFAEGGLEVDNSPAALRQAVEDSLQRLRTDYIDIFFLHFPNSHTPLDEAAAALAELKREGKIRAIGASNLDFNQLQQFNADRHLDILQTEYSLLARKAEEQIIPYCLQHGISVIPIFPLSSGLLAGRYNKDDVFTDTARMNHPLFQREAYLESLERVERLKAFAQQKRQEPAQIALAWLLQQPGVDHIIPGASRPEQIEDNLRTLDVQLSEDDLRKIDAIFR
ncbi:aldo/keto reductase [Paenibacillus harenae]|uniref:Aryl-alcohol dehydrogenase-like predicted oxidoreductase n=1 Tax=Paenibacillus harenae TaxID=306543 RepID=A0ABT9U2C8_PAEHA|nr:aldo/keto reductase [Paenibacillus harenae]MDQ0113782.1 aryl-alcohol dehydrogenase-like predicted oxidoreductase [Paenibacillus harenae]